MSHWWTITFLLGGWVTPALSAPLRFDHLCSELGNGYGAYRQAYAFFEKRAPDGLYEALALVRVSVGWIAGPPGPNGVALKIMKHLPSGWEGDSFLQMVSVQTQQTITSPERHLFAKDIPGLRGDYALNLVLENAAGRITLSGPVLENLPALLDIEKPGSGVLGLAGALNPFQEGGIWRSIWGGVRYRNCIDLREQLKRELDRRFRE